MPIRHEISATGRLYRQATDDTSHEVAGPEDIGALPMAAHPRPAIRKGRRLSSTKNGHKEDETAKSQAVRPAADAKKNPESQDLSKGAPAKYPWLRRLLSVFGK